MPKLRPGPADRELQRLIEIFLQAETDIINEIGRLRRNGLVDYHAEAALERVQAILRKLENGCWTYVPRMIETQFYVKHPEARKKLEEPESPKKHLRGYQNARVLTSEQMDIVQRLTMNLMGQVIEADATVMSGLTAQLIGRTKTDLFREIGLRQSAAMQATGRGVYKALPDMVAALRREGVTAFTDRAGRNWSLHTYGSMVLRTTSRQAEVLAVLTQDPEHDLYKISKHGTTCKLCAPLEGRVYSRSGTDPDFPPLAAAFGKMDKAGPATLENSWLNIHPNCLHQLIPWTPMGRSEKELQEIRDFSSFEKNPVTRDPRTKKQIEAYRKKEEDRARWLRDYRQWERYRETVGDPVPKTFETFRKHKYAVLNPETKKYGADDKFKAWEKSYRDANKVAKSARSGILNDKDVSAIKRYISSDSYELNSALRGEQPMTEKLTDFRDALDSALEKLPVYRGATYRSVSDLGIEDVAAFIRSHQPGTEKTFQTYLSSSTGVYDPDFPIQYVIQGKTGRDLRSFNQPESEILFPRGRKFRILKVEGNTIYMEEMDDG